MTEADSRSHIYMREHDQRWMQVALNLAYLGRYSVSPNPCVGCVLVKDDRVVAEGWHESAGKAHAEAMALFLAKDEAKGCTAYVTLEPCSHHGRTPPCADALIEAGVTRVVMAMLDPNPLVSGKGLNKLKAAGIQTHVGISEDAAQTLNAGFIKRMTTGLPWVALKMGMSLDGRIAMQSGESQWITGDRARSQVQELRAQACAILTTARTVIKDNARMTIRQNQWLGTANDYQKISARRPHRVVLDARGDIPITSSWFESGPSWVIAAGPLPIHDALEAKGHRVLVLPQQNNHWNMRDILELLAQQQVNQLLVEAGGYLAGQLLFADLLDELHLFIAPKILGSTAQPAFQLAIHSLAQSKIFKWSEPMLMGSDCYLHALRVTASKG